MIASGSAVAIQTMRIFKQVPRILFGREAFARLPELCCLRTAENPYQVFVVDSVHRGRQLSTRLPINGDDIVEWFDATAGEPSTTQVDVLRERVVSARAGVLPATIVGIGGGATMDVAKALSVMLTNEGSSAQYQGWDLVKRPAVFKVGVPTLSGSGAEASRTAVLMGKDRKFGINSDHSMFDAIVLDSSLIAGVPADQRFHSGMDCYIHCVESLQGTMINELAKAYAERALILCESVFLNGGDDDALMTASFMGGCSIVNSEVGVCHALSYGLSMELHYRHGFANCVVFDVLDDYYGSAVCKFRDMMKRNGTALPKGVTRKLSSEAMERMVAMTLHMERPLTNALGENWREHMTRERIIELYRRM